MELYVPASARRHIVHEECVGVYHCIARCVRRAFLCGTDSYSVRLLTHFLLHCGTGLKVAQLARLLDEVLAKLPA